MNYRSVADLNSDGREMAHSLSESFDLIVGIPRSGMLAASILALHMNLPLTDVEGLCNGTYFQSGDRYNISKSYNVEDVLIIDDSVCHGTQMEKTQNQVDSAELPYNIEYAAIYITAKGHQYVDYWSEVVDIPRYFEWNIMHHNKLPQMCVDIDGVLCRDPTPEENDDGQNYREFLRSVKPQIIPSKKIGWLVTSRLEKYRTETKSWLNEHGIQYDQLIMIDHPDKLTREMEGNHAAFKANVYESVDAELFIESSVTQSMEITERTGKHVYCYGSNAMIYPDSVSATKHQVKQVSKKSEEYLQRFSNNPVQFLKKAIAYVQTRLGDLKHKIRLIKYKIDSK